MRSAIQQLERLNYMRIVRERSASGRFIHSKWIVSDEPIVDWAHTLKTHVWKSQFWITQFRATKGLQTLYL